MGELEDFLIATIDRQIESEEAIHSGDPRPRLEMWSRNDPVTFFGAWGPCDSDRGEVERTFHWIASRSSNCIDHDFDLVAAGASGDLAYTVGYERSTRSLDGGPPETTTLRVTHVYRREDGEWKIVHRHDDIVPEDQRRTRRVLRSVP
jgi:ketosteroid isomerase-like protein